LSFTRFPPVRGFCSGVSFGIACTGYFPLPFVLFVTIQMCALQFFSPPNTQIAFFYSPEFSAFFVSFFPYLEYPPAPQFFGIMPRGSSAWCAYLYPRTLPGSTLPLFFFFFCLPPSRFFSFAMFSPLLQFSAL